MDSQSKNRATDSSSLFGPSRPNNRTDEADISGIGHGYRRAWGYSELLFTVYVSNNLCELVGSELMQVEFSNLPPRRYGGMRLIW
jgi:hypothetical protein